MIKKRLLTVLAVWLLAALDCFASYRRHQFDRFDLEEKVELFVWNSKKGKCGGYDMQEVPRYVMSGCWWWAKPVINPKLLWQSRPKKLLIDLGFFKPVIVEISSHAWLEPDKMYFDSRGSSWGPAYYLRDDGRKQVIPS